MAGASKMRRISTALTVASVALLAQCAGAENVDTQSFSAAVESTGVHTANNWFRNVFASADTMTSAEFVEEEDSHEFEELLQFEEDDKVDEKNSVLAEGNL